MLNLRIFLGACFFLGNLLAGDLDVKNHPCAYLIEAVHNNDLAEVTRLLLENRTNGDEKKTELANCRYHGLSPLHVWAQIDGLSKIFSKLLYSGLAYLDIKSSDGLTPFLIASAYKNDRAIIALMAARTRENSINVNAQDKRGFSALHLAIIGGADEEFTQKLITLGVDASLLDKNQRTASMLASMKGMKQMSYLVSPDDAWSSVSF